MCPEKDTTPQRDQRAFNAYRHGLTGQVLIMTLADQVAYVKHCEGMHQSLAPQGDTEKSLAQSIADDRWRILRAAAIDHTRFSLGMSEPDKYFAHHPEIDAAVAQAVVWATEAKNLNLMSLYEGRAQRRVEKNLAMLQQLQTERKAAFARAVEEATLLAQYAASQGESYNVERDFPPETLPPQFAFSLAEIARHAAHNQRLNEARKHLSAAKPPSAEPPEPFFPSTATDLCQLNLDN